jgi:tetratricopeptide (TPR) repeat protein
VSYDHPLDFRLDSVHFLECRFDGLPVKVVFPYDGEKTASSLFGSLSLLLSFLLNPKAIQAFGRAMNIDPRYESLRFNKGVVLLCDLKDPESAIKVWEELSRINPSGENL